MSQMTFTSRAQRQPSREDMDQRGRALLRQTTVLLVTSTSSFVLFLFLSLPFSALVSLFIFVSSTYLITYNIILYGSVQFELIVQGRGFGDYLSEYMYNQLTELTLHEWLQDGSFTLEHRHLMLYFIPGISPEQLETYIDRLPARHRSNLRRHGLGHFLGDAFMRITMGDDRYQIYLENQARPAELILPTVSSLIASRLLFDDSDDEDSDIGMSITADELIVEAPISSQVIDCVSVVQSSSRQEPTTRSIQINTPAEDLQREQEEESNILADAFTTMSQTYTNQTVTSMTGVASSMIEYFSPIVIGSGLTVSSISVGIGMFGVWSRAYYPGRARQSSPHFPSSRTLIGSTIAGGASVAFAYFFRCGIRSMIHRQRSKQIKIEEVGDSVNK